MKLPVLNRIRKEDIPEAPGWVDKIISPLNLFIEQVYNIFNKNVDFDYNVTAQIKEIKLKHTDLPYEFTCTLKSKPQGVIKLFCEKISGYHETFADAVDIDWTYQDGIITINHITGIDASSNYNLRLLII